MLTSGAGFISSHLARSLRIIEVFTETGSVPNCAKIKLDSKPNEAVLKKIGAKADEVIHVDLVEIA